MTFLRVAAFSLAVVFAYTLFANILPQVQSDPPQEEDVNPDTLDPSGQLAWGERLFKGKGTCTLCHNNLGRAPDLLAMDLATTISQRLSDPRYTGEARELDGAPAAEAYLRESLVAPSAFVVAGFGKKGTNDTVSPMPRANGAPISLSQAEVNAVIAFLQDRAGVEVTVPLPRDGAEAAALEAEKAEAEGPAATAEAAIEKFGCNACHDLDGSGAEVGPKLAGIGERLDRAALRRAILRPNAELAAGFEPGLMPQDYAAQMRVSELELLIDYLSKLPAAEATQ
ncbi:MAG: c-type cytochrome [Kiloniellaceae bacterium]